MINTARGITGRGGTKETMLANIDLGKGAAHSCQLKVTVPVFVCISKAWKLCTRGDLQLSQERSQPFYNLYPEVVFMKILSIICTYHTHVSGMVWMLEVGAALMLHPWLEGKISAWGMFRQLFLQRVECEDNLTRNMASGRETSLKAGGEI